MGSLWVSFGDLVDVLDKDMANVFCSTRGGLAVYIPKNPEEDMELARLVGFSGLRALSAVYGGETITTSNFRRGKPRKGQIIKMLEQGDSTQKIAMALDVTERYVEHIASVTRARGKQASLFDVS